MRIEKSGRPGAAGGKADCLCPAKAKDESGMTKNAPGGQGKALSDGGVLCLLCKKIYDLSVVLEIKTRYNVLNPKEKGREPWQTRQDMRWPELCWSC